jgi:integrase
MFELDVTTGLRSGELRGLAWPMVDLKGKRIHIVTQATRRRHDDRTKTESSLRTVPIPDYLIPELTRWKLMCPASSAGLVFPGPPNEDGERGPIDAQSRPLSRQHAFVAQAGMRTHKPQAGSFGS